MICSSREPEYKKQTNKRGGESRTPACAAVDRVGDASFFALFTTVLLALRHYIWLYFASHVHEKPCLLPCRPTMTLFNSPSALRYNNSTPRAENWVSFPFKNTKHFFKTQIGQFESKWQAPPQLSRGDSTRLLSITGSKRNSFEKLRFSKKQVWKGNFRWYCPNSLLR